MATAKIEPYKLIPHVLKALADLHDTPQTPTVQNIIDQVETNFPAARPGSLRKRVRDALKKGMEMGLFTQKKRGIFEIQLPNTPVADDSDNDLSQTVRDACCPRERRCRRRRPTPCCRRLRKPCCRRRKSRRCCRPRCCRPSSEDENKEDMNDVNKTTDSLTTKNYIVFIGCISPQVDDYFETVSTLRFAESTKEIKSRPEIQIIMNNFKEKNANQIEKSKLLIPMSYRTPARFHKLNHTISTPGHKSVKRKSPANSKFTFLEPLSTIKKPLLSKLNEDKNEENGFELDEANLSTSTLIDHGPTINIYSPIIRKCTKTLEKQIQTLVSKQLTTINRRKSKRLGVKTVAQTPKQKTSKLRLSSIMKTVDQRIHEVVEQKLTEMTEKMAAYSKPPISYKDNAHPKKLFTDSEEHMSNDINKNVNTEIEQEEYIQTDTLNEDVVFKVPQITIRN